MDGNWKLILPSNLAACLSNHPSSAAQMDMREDQSIRSHTVRCQANARLSSAIDMGTARPQPVAPSFPAHCSCALIYTPRVLRTFPYDEVQALLALFPPQILLVICQAVCTGEHLQWKCWLAKESLSSNLSIGDVLRCKWLDISVFGGGVGGK